MDPRGAVAARVSTQVVVVGEPMCVGTLVRKHFSRSCRVKPWMRSIIRRRSLRGSSGTPGGRRDTEPSTEPTAFPDDSLPAMVIVESS